MNKKYHSLVGIFGLVSFLLLITVMAIIKSDMSWYDRLIKPAWDHPIWLYEIWIPLYLILVFSGWYYYRAESSKYRTRTLFYYFVQLGLNALRPIFLFSFQNTGLSSITLALMITFAIMTIVEGFKVSKIASSE